jgi:hypothetical protein
MFLKYWSSSHNFNKVIIKVKMHVKIYFWIFVVWKYDMIFLIFFLETWPYIRKQDIFLFYNFLFATFSKKTRYINTEFVSLQYKNTNQY